MKNIRQILTVLVLMLNVYAVKAQDPHLSQYYSQPLFLNPALTGITDGQYRMILNNKTQWNTITDPYRTFAFSYDMPVKKVGLGLLVMNQAAGDGGYNNFSAFASFSYSLRFGKEGNIYAVFGLQGGVVQKGFDPAKLSFDQQYLPGSGYSEGLASGENFESNSTFYPDANTGVFLFDGNPSAKINTFVGYSLAHVFQPEENLFNISYKLPRRHTVHGGAKVKLAESFDLTPHGLFMFQGDAKEYAVGAYGEYRLKDAPMSILLGSTVRIKDAMVAYTGLQYKDFLFGVSYDFNTSSLQTASQGRGGLEFTLSFTKLNKILEPKFFCPRL